MIGIETLDEFIIRRQENFPDSSGELSRLLRDIGLAAKIVHREVNKAGLVDILGETGTTNIQGEEVKKLDVFANTRFIASLRMGGACCGIASEESENFIIIDDELSQSAHYIVSLDPLDGSSNIDVNVSVGTIFCIYKRVSLPGGLCQLKDFLQKGTKQAAAGYVIYGSSTMLVYTTGHGVNGFTLDPTIGEFCLSHPDITIPSTGTTYSVNQGNYSKFKKSVQKFISYCSEDDKKSGRPYSLRYVGSLVADIHRNLLKGGIFMYPSTSSLPHGKLRLLYECNPMAFIVEQAGGRAIDGKQDILELDPGDLHQRTPLFIGSTDLVDKLEEFIDKISG
ncbi:MAG: class 1 fructose-bisphosphatase [Candidatus Dadabacteria bacterium]|nr:class 1 fructose-bisphosphatase [Candidatus Dadabacteria bacterium]